MRRPDQLIFVGLVLCAGVAATALRPPGAPDQRPAQDHLQPPTGPQAPQDPFVIYLPSIMRKYIPGYVVPFGIDMYEDNSDAAGQAKMQAAGSGWETVYFKWSQAEPLPPVGGVHTYDWTVFDATVARAQSAGITLFVQFSYNPSWAADLRGGPVHTQNVQDLNSMLAAAAERYDGDGNAPGSPVVNYWSFYAEPDNHDLGRSLTSDKGYWGDNPGGYADMLAGVSTAIHAANPNAVVMIGGLAYDYFTTDGGPYVKSFLPRVLDALNTNAGYVGGAANTIGAVAFHYYPINTVLWPTIKEKTLEVRSIMTAHGVGNLPMVMPEMGYWSEVVPNHPEFYSNEPKQARTLVQIFVRGLSVGLQHMSWFMVFDYGTGTNASGLFRSNDLNNPKPSYSAYATLTAELFGAKYFGPLSGTGVEGYVFSDLAGGPQKTVVWATGQPSAQVVFHMSCVRRVDYLGNVVTPILDGDPTWDKDAVVGQITLQVLQDDPIYVSSC